MVKLPGCYGKGREVLEIKVRHFIMPLPGCSHKRFAGLTNSPGQTQACPWRGQHRSFCGHSLRGLRLDRVRASTRMMQGARRQAFAPKPGREKRPTPAQARVEQAPVTQSVRLKSGRPLRGIRQVHGHAAESILRIPASGWTPGSLARAWPADDDLRPEAERVQQTYQGRSPITSVRVQFAQNLTQTGNRRSRPWLPCGEQRGWRQPATAYCLGQKGISQDRTSGLSWRTDFSNHHQVTVCYQYRFAASRQPYIFAQPAVQCFNAN